MEEKHKSVRLWLDKTFAGNIVPQYEISEQTVNILHDVMMKNEVREKDVKMQIDDLLLKKKEYIAEAERMKQMSDVLNLCPENMSPSIQGNLRTLSSVALTLELNDCSDSSYLLGISDLSQRINRVSEERYLEQKQTANLETKSKSALLKSGALERSFQEFREKAKTQGPLLDKKRRDVEFIHTKSSGYHRVIQKNKAKLPPKFTSHKVLMAKSEELQEVNEKLAATKAKLDRYHSLPPNVALTKVKIEETKRELVSIEADLTKMVAMIK